MAAAAQSEARQPSPSKPAPRRTVITMLLSAWLPALAYLLASTHRSLHPQIRMGLADEDSAPLPPGLEKQVLRSPLPTALFRSQRGECLSYVTTHQHNCHAKSQHTGHSSLYVALTAYSHGLETGKVKSRHACSSQPAGSVQRRSMAKTAHTTHTLWKSARQRGRPTAL